MYSSFSLCVIDFEGIRERFRQISPHLNEFQRRIWAAAEANSIGRGGVTAVSHATGMSRTTIKRGQDELKTRVFPPQNRVRKKGGGRKKAEKKTQH